MVDSLFTSQDIQEIVQEIPACSIWLVGEDSKLYQFHCVTGQVIYRATLELDPDQIIDITFDYLGRGLVLTNNSILQFNKETGEIEASLVTLENLTPQSLTFWQGRLILITTDSKTHEIDLSNGIVTQLADF